jgi:hypothetical protein
MRRYLLPLTSILGLLAADCQTRDDEAALTALAAHGKTPAASPGNVVADDLAPADWRKGETFTCSSWDDKSETLMSFDGSSWTITRKDMQSGVIERFRQSGSGDSGLVEVIQGKAAPNAGDALHRDIFNWAGVEDKGPVQSIPGLVPLPRDMRDDVAGVIISNPRMLGTAFENLLPDSVRAEMANERQAELTRANAGPRVSSPTPAPA